MDTITGNSSSITEEELEDESWPQWIQVIIGIFLALLFITNIVGNTLTLVAFTKDRHLRTVQNYYIINLAVTDLIIGISSLPFYSVYTVMYFYWPFGYEFCKVWSVVDFWVCAESSLTIILISYDR